MDHEDAVPIGVVVAVLLLKKRGHLTRLRKDGRGCGAIVTWDGDFMQLRRRILCKGAKRYKPQTTLNYLRRVELRVSDVDQQPHGRKIIPGPLKRVTWPVRTCQGSSLKRIYRVLS